VTFAVKNLDLESLGEPEPPTFTSKPIYSEDKLDRLHSQMLPEVNSEQADHSVITQFHYYIPKAPIIVAATKPTITLVTPALDATNSIMNSSKNLKQAWAPAGGDLVVVYKVVGDDGKSAVPNKAVTLKINGGKSTLQATTDAFGFVAFTVKNSDAKPNSAPASATSTMPAASTAFATLVPEITGTLASVAEGVEFHYYRGITASAVKSGKSFVLSVQVNGAAGKSATISVTGAKKSTVRINAPRQVVPVKVTAGTKTVTVVIDGKSYTTKVVVK
jgi:flagellar capping protein FliD